MKNAMAIRGTVTPRAILVDRANDASVAGLAVGRAFAAESSRREIEDGVEVTAELSLTGVAGLTERGSPGSEVAVIELDKLEVEATTPGTPLELMLATVAIFRIVLA